MINLTFAFYQPLFENKDATNVTDFRGYYNLYYCSLYTGYILFIFIEYVKRVYDRMRIEDININNVWHTLHLFTMNVFTIEFVCSMKPLL